MRIEFVKEECDNQVVYSAEKENETAEAISGLLDGFAIEDVERILQRVRSNYGNAIYRKEFRDQSLP